MKRYAIFGCTVLLFSVAVFSSCSSDDAPSPEYHSEITIDEDLNVVDWGRAGQSTEDGNYYYNGEVTLYDEYGNSRTFPCYRGKLGMESGCRGVIYAGVFHNLDRNKWVTIGGVRYKASDIVD